MKAVSGKRKKTDADYDEMSRLEWFASLYRSEDDLLIPDHVIESLMIAGAKKQKRGTDAKCGLYFTQHATLDFQGKPAVISDDTLAEMFESGDFTHRVRVKVGMARVMRTRAIFRRWICVVRFQYDPDVLNRRDVEGIATAAGRFVGMGDWRPKHGRFEVDFD
jgi:hypothetical protein